MITLLMYTVSLLSQKKKKRALADEVPDAPGRLK